MKIKSVLLSGVTVIAAAAVAIGAAGPAAASTPSQDFSLTSVSASPNVKDEPVEVRQEGDTVEKDYAVGNGSILTTVETKASAEDGRAISVSPAPGGFYVTFSPEDQQAIIGGGTTTILTLFGAIAGGFGAGAGAIFAQTTSPYILSATCSADGKSARIHYQLDGTATDITCV